MGLDKIDRIGNLSALSHKSSSRTGILYSNGFPNPYTMTHDSFIQTLAKIGQLQLIEARLQYTQQPSDVDLLYIDDVIMRDNQSHYMRPGSTLTLYKQRSDRAKSAFYIKYRG